MEELLQKLLEAEVLSPETKTDLEGAFKTQLDEAITAAKEEAAADVRTELTEQWIAERAALVEAVDAKVGEYLEGEMSELREDIERFRDLEAEHAEKLVEAKAAMRDELKDDLKELVEKIDAFLEIRLASELEELHEDLETARKNDFGRRIFEAVAAEYVQNFSDDEHAETSLRETRERLGETEDALATAERQLASYERSQTMTSILRPLAGRQKEVMEAILRNVDTEHLEEGYKTFIGRVLRETDDNNSEEGSEVLAEGKKTGAKKKAAAKQKLDEGAAVNGDDKQLLEQQEEGNQKMSSEGRAELAHWVSLATGNK